mmetsp:Transcript_4589/g.5297  ORF Transcript_4589/g.5297 Transcript_4589/m.5297 type:complete len:98 (+) Transcript_4589:339-632(+)
MGEISLTLNQGHGFAISVAIFSAFVCTWAGFKVGAARKKYGVKYPTMYAPEGHKNEKEFNCIQRAHQNVLENYPAFLMLLLISSLNRPYYAAACGMY